MSDGKDVASPANSSKSDEAQPKVVVVVPTYNEAENLPHLARRIFALDMPACKLIVVDDGSPDGTGEVAARLGHELGGRVEVIQRGMKLGLGTAYVEGLTRAAATGAEYIVQMDADLSHAPECIPGFLDALREADVVVGSRYVPGGSSEEEWGLRRRALSRLGNQGIRMITGVKIKDVTSGFKGFQAEVIASMDLGRFRCKGFAFQAEMISACERKGLKVVEYPIVFAVRESGESKLSFGIVFEAIWRLLPLRWKRYQ